MSLDVLIRQLQGALNGQTIRAGSVAVTFSASDTSDTETVTHGLGVTPVSIQAQAVIFTPGIFAVVDPASIDDESFDLRALTRSGNHTGDVTIHWLAIG
jgi:hypothetical protein